MDKIERLYLHCSVSDWGNENVINHWHRARRFLTSWNGYQISTGYHFIVLNGFPYNPNHYIKLLDGSIETGRPPFVQGAGVKGGNRNSLHVCLIGQAGSFTQAQIQSAYKICAHYKKQGLDVKNVLGHYEYWLKRGEQPLKSCPGINMDKFRHDLKAYIERGTARVAMPMRIRTKDTRMLDGLNCLLGGNSGSQA